MVWGTEVLSGTQPRARSRDTHDRGAQRRSIAPNVSLPLLAVWESLIGLGLLTGRFLRATLLLLAVQMIGTLTPLFLFPVETFTRFPIAPTLEGQYIIKNVVLIGAAMVVGATVRGGGLAPERASVADADVRSG